MRDTNGKPQVIGGFVWEKDHIAVVEKKIEGAHMIMDNLHSEIDDSSSGTARASMERLARRYRGGYLWVKFEPGVGAGGREIKKMSTKAGLSIIGEALNGLLEKQHALKPEELHRRDRG